jgi:demethylmenaquinone methyltransferase/2-methoxy-6-polyprenyl-1,4-benzoquinol methylase
MSKNVKIYEKLAKKYDLATSIVSFGIEKIWRKIFVKKIRKYIKNGILLDVASATGDMAKEINFDKMYLLDPSKEMNKIAKEKLKDKQVIFIEDFAETCKCKEKVDLITAFMAVRNFDDLEKGIKNLDKYLKVGGYFAILELTKSDSLFFKISMFYMSKIVPLIGGIITGEFEAYKKFPKMIKNITDEDILKNFSNYEIIEKKRLFPPMATLIIMRKNE